MSSSAYSPKTGEVTFASLRISEKRSSKQGRSPASFLTTGCRGHPCPRRCGTHGGFHIKSFLRSYLLLRRDTRTPLHERSHVDLERPRTLRLIDQVHYLVANGGGRDEVRRIHVGH